MSTKLERKYINNLGSEFLYDSDAESDKDNAIVKLWKWYSRKYVGEVRLNMFGE